MPSLALLAGLAAGWLLLVLAGLGARQRWFRRTPAWLIGYVALGGLAGSWAVLRSSVPVGEGLIPGLVVQLVLMFVLVAAGWPILLLLVLFWMMSGGDPR